WSFDEAAGSLPEDFINILGDWRVEAEPSAPSGPNVLRQADRVKAPDFPRFVIKDLTCAGLPARVRCRPGPGTVRRACGLMFRPRASDTPSTIRAHPLEGNVRLYRVVAGDRQQLASAALAMASGQWHTLEATARGLTLTVRWDD